jgi:hypothetical protein
MISENASQQTSGGFDQNASWIPLMRYSAWKRFINLMCIYIMKCYNESKGSDKANGKRWVVFSENQG